MTLYYCCRREGRDFTISGRSVDKTQGEGPRLETKATFREGQGWVGGYIIHEGRKFEVMKR